MSRVLILVIVCVFTNALWQALALALPGILNVLFFPPIIMVFCMQYFRPFETVLIIFWCGAIVDILGGVAIGLNMLLMLLSFFILESMSIFSARLSLRELSVYAGILSFFYRLSFFLLEAVFMGHKTNIYIVHLCFGPLIDWLFSIPFYVLLLKVLVALKAIDQNDLARGVGSQG